MARYLKCKRGFAYRYTNNNGYYKTEDGEENKLEIVWHENKDLIGKVFEVARVAEDFEEIEESVVLEKFDEELSVGFKGWDILHKFDELSRMKQKCYNTAQNFIGFGGLRDVKNETIRTLLTYFYVPSDDDYEIPTNEIRIEGTSVSNNDRLEDIVRYVVDRARSYMNCLFLRSGDDSKIDEIVKGLTEKEYEVLDYPEMFLLPYKARSNKAVILRKENSYVSISTELKSYTVMAAVAAMAASCGRPFTENIINALLAEDGDTYLSIILADVDEWFRKTNVVRKDKMIEKFSEVFNEMTINKLRRNKENVEAHIQGLEEDLREYLNRKRDILSKIFYEEHGMSSKNEFLEMLKGMDNKPTVSVDRDYIRFCVSTPLTYWDDELWDIVRKSDCTFESLSDPQKVLLDEIFLHKTVKLMFDQKFWFKDNRVGGFGSNDDYNVDHGEGIDGIPNPHIHHYDCWGTHKPHIETALSESDYTTAYAQSVACISGITLDDSTVVNKFLRGHLFSDRYENRKCLQMQDGTRISIKEYLDSHKDAKWEE